LRETADSCSTGWSEDLRELEANGTRASSGNAANPVRTGLQHARAPRAEQTVEVVEIHEDGTRCAAGGAGTPKEGGNTDREWTLKGPDRRKGTNAGKTQERRIRRLIQGRNRRAEGGAKPMEDALGVVFTSTNERVRHRNTPRTHTATWKGRRGSSEGPTSCYCV